MKIAQLMTKDVKTCHQGDMLEAAVRLMWDHDIGVLPVVDDGGQLIGMVTDRDACMAAFMQRRPPPGHCDAPADPALPSCRP